MGNSAVAFKNRYAHSLKDAQLRGNLKKVMGGMQDRRKASLPDEAAFKALQTLGHQIKLKALDNLHDLLIQLETKCTENGIQVHWAETPEEANRIILAICRKRDAKRVIKGKSMATEETHLNDFLEYHGIEAKETDLGEYIVQLAQEHPSHIIAPAVHKNKNQIGTLFHDKMEEIPFTDNAKELNAIARKTLRQKFFEGDVGISGVNFAVAETGTLCLVENEGNGRMCTTVPPVHIALMGIEKIVPTLEELTILLTLLTRSATGQPITSYFNMINSPRKPGEKDGPEEVHLVLMDNKRTEIYQNDLLRKTLMCLRCGACLNHCPVYTRIGGHAYNQVYPGPIGKILSPQLNGLHDTGGIHTASSLCGACSEVCPVRIPIPDILLRLRHESVQKPSKEDQARTIPKPEKMAWKSWELMHSKPSLYRMGTKAGAFMRDFVPDKVGPLKQWTSGRTAPKMAEKSLHTLLKERNQTDE